MWLGILAVALLTGEVEISVLPLSGNPQSGRLVKLNQDQVELSINEEVQTFATENLLAIRPLEAPHQAPRPLPVSIDLVNGSQIRAADFLVSQREATIVFAEDDTIGFPSRSVRAVRFNRPLETLNDAWQNISSNKVEADLIVIRKNSTTLDHLEGIVRGIGKEKIAFEIDDSTVNIDRRRLEGVVYYRPRPSSPQTPPCQVTDNKGNTWQATSVEFRNNDLHLACAGDVNYSFPLEELLKIDFSSGNLVYLSDLEPELSNWNPFFASLISRDRLAKLYKPRRDRSFSGSKLTLYGVFDTDTQEERTFEKGVAIRSKTELAYRLTEKFARFRAIAGIDSQTRSHGHVELTIWGDDKELFKSVIHGGMEPVALDLDLMGIKRLKFLVAYGEQLDIGDHLNLCNARFIK